MIDVLFFSLFFLHSDFVCLNFHSGFSMHRNSKEKQQNKKEETSNKKTGQVKSNARANFSFNWTGKWKQAICCWLWRHVFAVFCLTEMRAICGFMVLQNIFIIDNSEEHRSRFVSFIILPNRKRYDRNKRHNF